MPPEVGSSMAAGGCIVSCTSGEPTSSRTIIMNVSCMNY